MNSLTYNKVFCETMEHWSDFNNTYDDMQGRKEDTPDAKFKERVLTTDEVLQEINGIYEFNKEDVIQFLSNAGYEIWYKDYVIGANIGWRVWNDLEVMKEGKQ